MMQTSNAKTAASRIEKVEAGTVINSEVSNSRPVHATQAFTIYAYPRRRARSLNGANRAIVPRRRMHTNGSARRRRSIDKRRAER
jgi:hypothetical protein